MAVSLIFALDNQGVLSYLLLSWKPPNLAMTIFHHFPSCPQENETMLCQVPTTNSHYFAEEKRPLVAISPSAAQKSVCRRKVAPYTTQCTIKVLQALKRQIEFAPLGSLGILDT